ncbi:Uncharacterized protein FKW44_014967 [Caligus rogercresseyi]|uniref:Uncharacterized protein n=1 Tax=Caligus rogercresseyi TaxID=217165 RepID=A0A7T8GZN1_CALRO|nr:Uncharacterized protein FKW44_014967 [Caligus rogercresseyi]
MSDSLECSKVVMEDSMFDSGFSSGSLHPGMCSSTESSGRPAVQMPCSSSAGLSRELGALSLSDKLDPEAWREYYEPDEDGDVQLHLAIASGFVEVVYALIRMVPDPEFLNIQNNHHYAPLHIAVLQNQPALVRRLVISGARLDVRDREGNTPLHLAARRGLLECGEALLKSISVSELTLRSLPAVPVDIIDLRNAAGETVVHLATMGGHEDFLRFLSWNNADINALEGRSVENENQGEQRGRKRQRNPDSWKRNIKKRLRISGQSYANGKNINVPARKVKEKDCAACRYKCNSNFPEPERQNIFDQFWSMVDVSRQKDFIINHTVTTIKKRQTTQTESKRKNSIEYRLTTQGDQIRTCKDFFLKTLDITEKFARSALDGQSSINLGISPPSTHGKHAPANKISEKRKNLIRNHINSFPTIESHYCRKDTTRQYLGENLNTSKMYDLYVSKCNNEWEVSAEKISLYRHIFNTEFNLGFHQPTKDACKYCEWFKGLNDHEKEVNLEEYNAHQNRKTQARDQKEEDKRQAQQESTFMAVTFDLEQVLTTPWSNVSSLFYSRKLSTYNLTVYELGSKAANCYMWHEGEGGRGSCEISTCVFRYLSSLSSNIDHVVLYSDTCGGQNRNAGFSAMCLHAVKDLPISIIDHKFMESGHSQMECDSVHAAIETARKNVPVYSPQGYYTLVRMARKTKPYEVIELGHADFLDFKSLSQPERRESAKGRVFIKKYLSFTGILEVAYYGGVKSSIE